jgi:hypothetical protein
MTEDLLRTAESKQRTERGSPEQRPLNVGQPVAPIVAPGIAGDQRRDPIPLVRSLAGVGQIEGLMPAGSLVSDSRSRAAWMMSRRASSPVTAWAHRRSMTRAYSADSSSP